MDGILYSRDSWDIRHWKKMGVYTVLNGRCVHSLVTDNLNSPPALGACIASEITYFFPWYILSRQCFLLKKFSTKLDLRALLSLRVFASFKLMTNMENNLRYLWMEHRNERQWSSKEFNSGRMEVILNLKSIWNEDRVKLWCPDQLSRQLKSSRPDSSSYSTHEECPT